MVRRTFRDRVFNSTFMAVVITVAHVMLGSMAGYALAKNPFRGSTVLFWIHIVAMMLPFEVILVSLFYALHMAGAVLAAIPVILVFLAFQRYFLRA